MSENKESIRDKILTNSSDIKSIDSPPVKKKNKWSLAQMFLMFFGVDLEKAKKGKATDRGARRDGPGMMPPPGDMPHPPSGGSRDIRDIYSFDPVAYDNMRIYLQGQDGRGDPKQCDCDHDHDER